jgi:hypothetical protein
MIVADANRFLPGWAPYFGYGNSARQLDKIRDQAVLRLTVFISKRHRRSRAFGRYVFGFASPSQLGLIALHGIVAAPGPSGAGGPPGQRRMPAVNDVGNPYAGEPRARFDGRWLETEYEHHSCHRASRRPYAILACRRAVDSESVPGDLFTRHPEEQQAADGSNCRLVALEGRR